MIRRLAARGVNGRLDFDLKFNSDLNLITGKNDSGKTTALKLAWFLLSANIEYIWSEARLDNLLFETDEYTIHARARPREGRSQSAEGRLNSMSVSWTFMPTKGEPTNVVMYVGPAERMDAAPPAARKLNSLVLQHSAGGSLFFPTFRRIEGGFGIRSSGRTIDDAWYGVRGIDDALRNVARALTVRRHRLVASISTADIVNTETS